MLAPRQRHEEDLIDMTAMVDIVFFLLIFFLVTSMQMAATVLPLPTPERQAASQKTAAVPTQADPGSIVVRIDADDVILVDDEVIFGGTALQAALADARDQRSPDAPVLVIGSGDASHGAAVRVLDACASARLANVRFLVEDDEAAP
jgi:biopolymer transport protein ExbD